MKKILILGTALLCGFLGRVAAQGVEFRDLTFGQALEQARTENKLVFMDCYTSWCGPCKNMLKNVFTLPEAGEFMNAHFVCVKYDMEKGEGIGLKNSLQSVLSRHFLLSGRTVRCNTGWPEEVNGSVSANGLQEDWRKRLLMPISTNAISRVSLPGNNTPITFRL